MVKFWGSIAEMTGNYFTGSLVLDYANLQETQKILKKNLLW